MEKTVLHSGSHVSDAFGGQKNRVNVNRYLIILLVHFA